MIDSTSPKSFGQFLLYLKLSREFSQKEKAQSAFFNLKNNPRAELEIHEKGKKHLNCVFQ